MRIESINYWNTLSATNKYFAFISLTYCVEESLSVEKYKTFAIIFLGFGLIFKF